MRTTLCREPMGFIALPSSTATVNGTQQQLDKDRTTGNLGPVEMKVWLTPSVSSRGLRSLITRDLPHFTSKLLSHHNKLARTCLKFAGAVPLTCNRTLIASITNSFSARSHRSHSYAGYSLLSGRPARGSASVSQRRLCCAVALTPRHPSCQLAEARLSPAPAEPRGSAGHAWSAGFDWAAVVVVTGRRRSCGQTVPGAARSLPPPPRPPSPDSPPPARARRRPLPHGLRPGKDGLGAPPQSRSCGLRGQVGGAPGPGGRRNLLRRSLLPEPPTPAAGPAALLCL
nr:PREDICTED: uncharacterized protein LOC103547851 [Equus przewalskii]